MVVVDTKDLILFLRLKEKANIQFCDGENSLVFLLLNLLKKLQDIGTVPAVDFTKYAQNIETKYYKET